MDAKKKGAWLVHHTLKLQQVSGVHEFDNIFAAGKAAILLSALSANDQTAWVEKRSIYLQRGKYQHRIRAAKDTRTSGSK
jgi:hypothetical protein